MKEQSLVEMKNKVDALVRVLQQIMNEQQHLTTLAAGTLETLKLMPGYADAIKAMTEKAKKEIAEEELHKKKVEDDLRIEGEVNLQETIPLLNVKTQEQKYMPF